MPAVSSFLSASLTRGSCCEGPPMSSEHPQVQAMNHKQSRTDKTPPSPAKGANFVVKESRMPDVSSLQHSLPSQQA